MENIDIHNKDVMQKKIVYITLLIWIFFCIISLVFAERRFVYGVFFGGIISMLNLQWLCRHINAVVRLAPSRGASYMSIRFVLRLAVVGAAVLALLAWVQINILGLFLGLSVVMFGIMCYIGYTYLSSGGI
jgi:hypothetical protein